MEAGLRLRQAMLINGILFNTEAWHSVNVKDVIELEKVDETLLRGLLQAHPKIPLEALYLETKSIPIRYILASRRILYLHNILQKDENEMIRKIYNIQKENPTNGDFSELVKQDMITIGLDINEDELMKIPKSRFKRIVKQKIQQQVFSYLNELKKKHSKMENLHYVSFETAPYLKSPLFNSTDISLLLALRTRTVRGIRNDFGGLYNDKLCPLKCGDTDTLKNVLTCKSLLQKHSTTEISNGDIRYEDIFGADIKKQKRITELFKQLLEIRNQILQNCSVNETDPVQSISTLQKFPILSQDIYSVAFGNSNK